MGTEPDEAWLGSVNAGRRRGARIEGEAFPELEDAEGLTQASAGVGEGLWAGGVEGEEIVVAGNHQAGVDLMGELGGLGSGEVAGDAAFRGAPIDREDGEVGSEGLQPSGHALIPEGVAAVVDVEGAEFEDVAEAGEVAVGIAVERFMGGRDGVDSKGEGWVEEGRFGHRSGRSVEADDASVRKIAAFAGDGPLGFGTEKEKPGIGGDEGAQGVGIEMVGVAVAGADDVDADESGGIDDADGKADVGFVGAGVLAGEGIRQVGIDQETGAAGLEEVSALAEPPDVEDVGGGRGGGDVGEEGVVVEEGLDHGGGARGQAVSCSMARRRLYLASRSERVMEPILIWSPFQPVARSASQ